MQIENIHIGDHIVVLGQVNQRDSLERSEHSGWPALVTGICPPYIAFQAVGHGHLSGTKTIDTRLWDLTKAPKRYVKAFEAIENQPTPVETITIERSACPICKQGLFKFMETSTEGPHWRCDSCRAVVVEEACQS